MIASREEETFRRGNLLGKRGVVRAGTVANRRVLHRPHAEGSEDRTICLKQFLWHDTSGRTDE